MARFVFWRLLQMPLIIAVIFLITFVLSWMIPGNPLERFDQRRPDREVALAMQRQYNLDNPVRFATSYLKGVFRGDFGPSLRYRDQRVNSILASGFPVSAALGVLALEFALIVGLGAGILGALKPGTPLDWGSLGLALVGVSLPTFVTGSILLMVFGGLLHWAPVGVWEWSRPGTMVLPAITLGLIPAAYIARLTRLGLADVMNQDFVRTARAKGLSERQALFRHALKVAFLPVLSYLGPAAAVTMTGSFVVERVFAIPGLGEHFVNAVLNKDQFLILGVVLVYATLLVVFNLIVDVAYAWVDPRIELA
jgi:oligopeptide transport system permease protein